MKISNRIWAALLAGGLLTGCTALLGSFDVGPGGTDGTDGGGVGPDGQSLDGNGPGSDGSPLEASDEPVVCTSPQVACGKVCATLATSPDHCGKCGHSCGGGACRAGQCMPFKLYDGTVAAGPVDVGDANIFFATTDGALANKLLACPKTGCTLAPKQLAAMGYEIRTVAVVQKGTIVFESAPTQNTERPALYACGIAGCPSPPISFVADGLNGFETRLRVFNDHVFYNTGGSGVGWSSCLPLGGPCSAAHFLGMGTSKGTTGFSADATNMYFVDSAARGNGIAMCAQNSTTCTPTVLVAGPQTDVLTTATDGGKLFWIKRGRDSFTEGKLIVCDLPACAAPKPIAVGLDSPTELLVDVSGAYWFTAGNKLQRCAPGGCAGGAQDFAGATTPLDTPHSLTADDLFVYWSEKSSVWRLAK